jgi:predicted Zn-dependent peptidase
MKKAIPILLVFLLFASGTKVFSQGGKIAFTEFDLKNGMHVILHQNNSVPTIAVDIMYHVGSKNENPDRTGFAHFFEHLMFEGSNNIGRGQFFKYIQNAGGENNANTTFDRTNYFEVLPSNQLELGLWLESERMLHLKIDSIGIETQRKVVKEERRQRYENQPYGRLASEIFSAAYKVHPYRWMPIGEDQYIDQAKYNEFMDFYKEFYVPQNAVLVIAGDIQVETAKSLVKKYFEDIPAGKIPIFRPTEKEPPQTKEIDKTVYDKVQLPAVVFAYHSPAMGTPDSYAMSMLQKYLTGGESSKFYKSLVDQQQLAVFVSAFPFSLEDDGLFIIYGMANVGKTAEELEKAMDIEVIKAKTEEISDENFQKIKNQIENDFYSQNSTMKGIANDLAENYTFMKDANLINTEIEQYQKITKADLKRVANQYLKTENRVVLYYLPESLKNKEAKP